MEQIKFKKLDYTVKNNEGVEEVKQSEARLPIRATKGDAGLDIFCTRMTQEVDNSGRMVLVYHTDLAVEIPEGYFGLLCMKSSISQRSIIMANAVGVIDSGYRGELIAKFKVTTDAIPTVYTPGEPFAQLIILPCETPEPVLVEELSESERETKSFGEATEEIIESLEAEIVEDNNK